MASAQLTSMCLGALSGKNCRSCVMFTGSLRDNFDLLRDSHNLADRVEAFFQRLDEQFCIYDGGRNKKGAESDRCRGAWYCQAA